MTDEIRKIPPRVYSVAMPVIPEVKVFNLDNGIPVYYIEAGTEDVLRIEFTFHAGQVKEHMPLIASTTNMMLKEGSQNYSADEMNRILDFYGSFVHLSLDRDRAGIIVFCLSKHLEKILDLSHEILFRPAFPDMELNALMRKRIQWFHINRSKVQNIAIDQFFENIFGSGHPYGRQIVERDFESVCPPQLQDFHSAHYAAENMAIIISGKIPADAGSVINRIFGSVGHSSGKTDEIKARIRSSNRKKVHIEKEGSVQTAIRIGSTTINKRHADYTGLKVVNTILGGYFGSRLMKNIREDKGYTYGIRSGVASLDLSGYLVISTEVGKEHTGKAIDEIFREIEILQTELISNEELDVVRNYMNGEILRMFDGPFAIAESFKAAWEFGLDNTYYKRFAEKIRNITPDEIKALASTYFNIDELFQVTAGRQ